jgi:hypothetical protein
MSSCGLGGVVSIRRAICTVASSRSGFLAMPPRKPKPPKPALPEKVNPWDPPHALQGDANESAIYETIGRSLTDWEFVEEALARIFAALVGTVAYPRAGPAVRAYGSIIGFKARADMIRAAGETFFQSANAPQFQVEFDDLMTECLQWSNRRNDIAHGRVWPSAEIGHLLFPALYATKKYRPAQTPAYSYSSKEIKRAALGFQDLYDRLSELAGNLEAQNRAWSARLRQLHATHPKKKDQET